MSRLVTLAGYAVLVATALGLEWAARGGRVASFGGALGIVLRSWPARVVLIAAWLWLGWHLFVRVDWR